MKLHDCEAIEIESVDEVSIGLESFKQRWKRGWSTGTLLLEGNGRSHFWQKDCGQVYRTCRDFYQKG